VDLNNLFEDLEAQFEAEAAGHLGSGGSMGQQQQSGLKLPPQGPILVELQLVDGPKLRLIAATLGLDFVAGVELGSSAVVAIANRAIAEIKLHQVSATQSYPLKITGREFTEFCGIFTEKKSAVKLHFTDPSQRVKHGWITGQFLNLFEFADRDSANQIFLPSCSISRIEVLPVHN
jgi:hypothetical protein